MTALTSTVDEQGIVTIVIDMPDRRQNVLTPLFRSELGAVLDRLASDDSLIGAILTSGKASSFMAGADLQEIMALIDGGITAPEAAAWVRASAAPFRRIETCGKPVVAAINGVALGGGLELALACHRRILLDRPDAVVGLPEVTLGLLPGGGGTQRLARMIGIEKALPILLDGKSLAPAQALALGVVNELASEQDLLSVARAWLLTRPSAVAPWDIKGFKLPGGAGPLAPHAPQSFTAGASRLKATRRCYPAPHAILSAVYEGTQLPFEAALRVESKYFGKLVADPVSGNLVRSFLRKGAARKQRAGGTEDTPLTIRKLGVIGAGMMGAGIANVAAAIGIDVVLLDRDNASAMRGHAAIRKQREREAVYDVQSAS